MKVTAMILASLVFASFTAGARDLEREVLHAAAEKASTSKGSGTNVGGGNSGSEYLASWCRGQLSLLRSYQSRSQAKLENDSRNINLANKILTDGIIIALEKGGAASETFLHKSLVRGLAISNHLGGSLGGTSEKQAQVANFVLNKYYDFMLEVVAKNLDLNGHLPYLGAFANTPEQELRKTNYEFRFVEYAKNQLDWILNNLVKEVNMNGKRVIVPVGNADSVLKVALTLSSGTADDLEESLWGYRFSCAISDLKLLNEMLSKYVQGNKEIYENERDALTSVTQEIARISNDINLRKGCQ